MNRLRPPKDCEDLALWLSGVVNDALQDALEAGIDASEAWMLLANYARFADPLALGRYPPPTSERARPQRSPDDCGAKKVDGG